MFKKLSFILGISILLSSVPITGFAQEKESTEVHHTGVKRTYLKAKHKVKHAWNKTKAKTSEGYNKAKNRIKTDDAKRDGQEKK